MSDQHSSPIKTWQQLVVVVVAAFVVPVLVIAMLAALVTSGKKGENADPKAVVERIRPVGTVQIAGPRVADVRRAGLRAGMQDVSRPGTRRRTQVRRQGRLGEGDQARREDGLRARDSGHSRHAAERRQLPNCRTTRFMRPSCTWSTQSARTGKCRRPRPLQRRQPRRQQRPRPAAPIVAVVIPPAAAPAPTGKADGKNVYETACAACHGAGVAGAPKFGDKVAWAPRLTSGKDTLYASSLKGKGAMPAEGRAAAAPGRSREGGRRLHDRRGAVTSSA